jgi:hypothetical protein
MGLYKVKNLYVNGCSFTAGDNIEEGFIWPELLAKKMNLDLNCRAINGSSMDTIFYNTINHLQNFDSKETYVIIGITWPERFGVFFDKTILNVTPADLDVKLWKTKINTWRRLSGPTLVSQEELDDYSKETIDTELGTIYDSKDWTIVLEKFLEYYKASIKYDKKSCRNEHIWIKLITQVLALDSYLTDNGFEHCFVGWRLFETIPHTPYLKNTLIPKLKKLNLVDFKRKFGGINEEGLHNSHPTEDQCIDISERIYDSING